ncbi:hypothetical protein M409DRAFT_49114 [Zasmidium cellare ATCC 36951]|uniref:Uncharacterized protein n=1 Tax=Zasmidium cellare ATCC 36951 TaxID=1080233 RepID=A0A6A6D5C2_ZASCE|nr:uncharacterized protein M409DRAFT_49114 [Zasmidium cellare ATCC 36951]KAF2174255.1 hypothetical protein M409DRAFT_49114 [Zasmidium cellare ATCC 36951]
MVPTYTLAALAMLGTSWAAPFAEPVPTDLPASSSTQTSINQLRDQLGRLTDAISPDRSINAQNGFKEVDAQFQNIAGLVKTPGNATSATFSISTPSGVSSMATSPASGSATPTSQQSPAATASVAPPETFPTHNPSLSTPTSTAARPENSSTQEPSEIDTLTNTPATTPSVTAKLSPSAFTIATTTGTAAPADLTSAYNALLDSIDQFNNSLTTYGDQSVEAQRDIDDLSKKSIRYDQTAIGSVDLEKQTEAGCALPNNNENAAAIVFPKPANQTEAFSYVQQIHSNVVKTYEYFRQGNTDPQNIQGNFCTIASTWTALADWVGNYGLFNKTML